MICIESLEVAQSVQQDSSIQTIFVMYNFLPHFCQSAQEQCTEPAAKGHGALHYNHAVVRLVHSLTHSLTPSLTHSLTPFKHLTVQAYSAATCELQTVHALAQESLQNAMQCLYRRNKLSSTVSWYERHSLACSCGRALLPSTSLSLHLLAEGG